MIIQAFRQKEGETGSVDATEPLRDLISLREPRDAVEAAVRRAQLEAVLRLVPITVTSQVIAAMLVVVSLYGTVPGLELALWSAAAFAICAFRGARALRLRADPDYAARKPPELKAIFVVVSLLASLWLVPPILWFDTADFEHKLMLFVLAAGLMSASSVSLASAPQAGLVYILIVSSGGFIVGAKMGSWELVVLLLLYTAVLSWALILNARRFVSHSRAQIELNEQSELIRLLREFEASGSDWLWELDDQSRLRYMSKAMADAFGRPLSDLIGRPASEILDPDGRATPLSAGIRRIADHARQKIPFKDIAVPVRFGQRWWSISGKPLIDSSGKFHGWRGVGSDITDIRLSGSDSVRAARLDPLTGLANRLLVREQLEESLLRQLSGDGGCALLLVDLDRFKLVNDTLGHSVGDQLLCEVARRLEASAGVSGTVGRLGGDEFALVWRGPVDRETLAALAEAVIAEIGRPFAIGTASLHVGATAGIACGPDDGGTEEALIRSADLALYRAKACGRGGYQFFAGWMAEEAMASRRLESDLRSALNDGGLSLAYQPIVDARSGKVVGREALLRWSHPEHGEIPPETFIPIIEEAGLIGSVGAWVLREACAEAIRWPDAMTIAVNVSPVQLGGAGLEATVVAALAASGLPADRLELEVTESIFLSDDPGTRDALRRLRSLGVHLVLDDFGTGYSSFGSLARGEFSKIKIDRSFACGAAAGDRQARAIVEAMIGLARGLGLVVTAEGVETAEQADSLRNLGCNQLQGFHFGRPARTLRQALGKPPEVVAEPPLRRRISRL